MVFFLASGSWMTCQCVAGSIGMYKGFSCLLLLCLFVVCLLCMEYAVDAVVREGQVPYMGPVPVLFLYRGYGFIGKVDEQFHGPCGCEYRVGKLVVSVGGRKPEWYVGLFVFGGAQGDLARYVHFEKPLWQVTPGSAGVDEYSGWIGMCEGMFSLGGRMAVVRDLSAGSGDGGNWFRRMWKGIGE